MQGSDTCLHSCFNHRSCRSQSLWAFYVSTLLRSHRGRRHARVSGLPDHPAVPGACHILTSAEEEDLPENTLFVHLRVPLGNYIDARFWFTYRLVHPSGEIQWLGEFGRNGELVIEKGLPGVDLREGWNIAEDGTYRTHAFPGERVLGHLTDPEAWVCWSWRPSRCVLFPY